MDLSPAVLDTEEKTREVAAILSGLVLDNDTIDKVKRVFRGEVELGLKFGLEKSSVQMETTYVTQLLTGTETGKFLALDLGSTNFRVLLVKLSEGKIIEQSVKHFEVSTDTRTGPGENLFSFLADCINIFLEDLDLLTEQLSLGFTFSFPMSQEGLAAARLVSWTKSFNCPGVEGKEVVELLQNAINNKKLQVKVVAILNDTTGTLVAGSYVDPNCTVGLIMGSGHNGCYFESSDNIVRWSGSKQWVIVDPEFGAFGDPGMGGVLEFVRSEFDNKVDEASLLPGKYTFEKFIGGNFLGEIARYALEKLHKTGLLHLNDPHHLITQINSFPSKFITEIEKDHRNYNEVHDWLDTYKYKAVTDWLGGQDANTNIEDDLATVQYVCAAVSERCAVLASVCVAELCSRNIKEVQTVAVDGSVFKHHPLMKQRMTHFINKFAPNKKVTLTLAEDGSGRGAAFLAAIVTQ